MSWLIGPREHLHSMVIVGRLQHCHQTWRCRQGEVYLAEDTSELKRKVGINAHDLHCASSSPLFDQRQIPRAEFYRL